MPETKISLLDGSLETLNLIWPIIVFAFILSHIFFPLPLQQNHLLQWGLFLSATLFLNVLHQAFTFFMILCLPETRSWILQKSQTELCHPFLKWGLLFVAFTAIFYGINSQFSLFGISVNASVLLLNFTTIHHTNRQFFGFSMLYNRLQLREKRLGPAEFAKFRLCESRERLLFPLLLTARCSRILAGMFRSTVAAMAFLGKGLALLTALLGALILLNSFAYPGARKSNKSFYLLRVLFFAFIPMMPEAALGSFTVHGVEYGLLSRKMVKASRIQRSASTFLALAASLVLVLAFLPANYRFGIRWLIKPFFAGHLALLYLLAAVSYSLTLLHYFLDRQLFRFSDPLVLAHISPLVTSPGKVPSSVV